MLLESKNGLLVKFDQYMYQRETYMPTLLSKIKTLLPQPIKKKITP